MLLSLLACSSGILPDLAAPVDTARAGDTARALDSDVTETLPDIWEPPEWDPDELPADVPTVAIEISAEAMARLDAAPYTADDEVGVFIDEVGVRHDVDLNYRGAYALRNVMSCCDLRNWKVKFASDDRYLDRREWNFNYEPHVRQKLAYDLFRFAGLAAPGAQHVLLEVNGEPQGLYLRYEDPDNLRWLSDSFGDDEGDLYKAAYDLPELPVCWADLTWLGSDDADYPCHYNKKTNLGDPDDYGVIRGFITDLNGASDAEIEAWLEGAFDVDRFLSYLAVSNFIANWDSYPQRPKNYWLYEDPRTERVVFIPWDLDGTFNPYVDGTWNQMGTTASIFFNLLESDYAPPNAEEGVERPLARRVMALEGHREAYVARYRALSEGVLSPEYLEARLAALTELAIQAASASDGQQLRAAERDVSAFIQQRAERVRAELDSLP